MRETLATGALLALPDRVAVTDPELPVPLAAADEPTEALALPVATAELTALLAAREADDATPDLDADDDDAPAADAWLSVTDADTDPDGLPSTTCCTCLAARGDQACTTAERPTSDHRANEVKDTMMKTAVRVTSDCGVGDTVNRLGSGTAGAAEFF